MKKNFKILIVLIISMCFMACGSKKISTTYNNIRTVEQKEIRQKILTAFDNEKLQKDWTPDRICLFKKYVSDMDVYLNDLLNEKISVETIIEVTIIVTEKMIEDGFAKDLIKAIEKENGVKLVCDNDEPVNRLLTAYKKHINCNKHILENLDEIISRSNVTREEILSQALNEKNMKKWKDGTLTVYDVLTSQPSIFIM